jgi:hypothetical protein
MIQAWIVMIRAPQHDDADAILAFQLIDDLAGAFANVAFVVFQCLESGFDGTIVFFVGQAEHRVEGLEHLEGEQLAVGEVQDRIDVLDIVLGENVVLFRESCFHGFRRGGDGGAGVAAREFYQGRVENVVHREKDNVERLLAVLFLDQVVDMRNADLGWEAGIDGTAACAGTVEFGTGVIGVDHVLRLHAQAFEVRVEQRRVGVNV